MSDNKPSYRDLENRIKELENKLEVFEYKNQNKFLLNYDKIKSIIDNMQDAYFQADLSGKFIFANPAALRIYGYDLDELIGAPATSLYAYSIEREEILNELRISGKITDRICQGLKKDGTKFCVSMNIQFLIDANGKIGGTEGVVRDISDRKKIEQELQNSEERFELSMEATQDGIWDWNINTDDCYFSPGYYKMIGYEIGEFPAKGGYWKNFIHPDDFNTAITANMECIEGKTEHFEIEYRIKQKNGKYIWVLGRGKCVLRDENGLAVRLIGTHMDITQRKQYENDLTNYKDNLELLVTERTKELQEEIKLRIQTEDFLYESESKYRNLIDYSTSIVLEWGTEGNIIFLNKYGFDFFGFTHEEIIGKNVLGTIVEPVDTNGYDLDGKMKIVQKNPEEFYSSENQNVKKNGEKVWIAWTNKGIYDSTGKLIKTLSVGIDRTKQHQMEKELINYRDHLKEMVERQTKELTETNQKLIQAKEKAEESNRLKTAFLNNMSHEVRTPLNAILGFSELLTYSNHENQELNNYCEIIADNSVQLMNIVTDVIIISQIQSSQINVNLIEFDLIKFISYIKNDFIKTAKRKKIELKFHYLFDCEQLIINTDKEKLKIIVSHLIDNAIKFTNQGSVDVKTELIKNSLQITIKDTGIGISDEMKSLIFEPFRQAEVGLTRKFGGNGLGLSIVKAFTDLLKGRLEFSSEVDKGSTFIVSIPTNITENNDMSKIEEYEAKLIKNILIVDDEYTNYLLLDSMIDKTKVNLSHVDNGQKAVDFCKSKDDIDLILMDIRMPYMDGCEAAKLIKEFKPNLPIIAQTVFALENEKKKYENIFDDYLTKPIDRNDFTDVIRKYSEKQITK